jgi:hypothetical protein
MKLRWISARCLLGAGLGACIALLTASAAMASANSHPTLIVPHPEAKQGAATITPHIVEAAPTAPTSPAPTSPVSADPAPRSSGGSSGSTAPASAGTAPSAAPAQSPAPDPSNELKDAARHPFAGTPDFYQRDPVQAIFDALPMSDTLTEQLRASLAGLRTELASTSDLDAYLEVMGKITSAELALGYIEGWTPTLSVDVEAEARHRFAPSPDFYQRDPVQGVFSGLPAIDQLTSSVDALKAELASSNNDPESYFQALRALTRVEEVLAGVEAARGAQGQLETREILGYSEVGDRECLYGDWENMNYAIDDPHTTGSCN